MSKKAARPFAICMTGISGSGKTTLANALAQRMSLLGISFDVIDGDDSRRITGKLFGYDKDSRMKMAKVNKTIGWYLLRNNVSFALAVVSAFEDIRAQLRELFEDAYIEVYVKCSVETCMSRDTKGYYKLSKEGKMENLNGVTDVYEIPTNSHVVIDTEQLTVSESCDIMMEFLENSGYIM